jgi:hypothetical protein
MTHFNWYLYLAILCISRLCSGLGAGGIREGYIQVLILRNFYSTNLSGHNFFNTTYNRTVHIGYYNTGTDFYFQFTLEPFNSLAYIISVRYGTNPYEDSDIV